MLGQLKTESCVGDGEFGVTAVDGIASKARAIAEILPARPAIGAVAVCPAEPRNANALSDRECGSDLSVVGTLRSLPDFLAYFFHAPDNLMSKNQWQLRIG
jgi:hypothetical protein